MKFAKIDPRAFLEGTVELPPDEFKAYTRLIFWMYDNERAVPDDPGLCLWIIGATDKRVWNRIRAALIRRGKLIDTGDGTLANRRVSVELQAYQETVDDRRRAGSKGGRQKAESVRQTQTYEGKFPLTDENVDPYFSEKPRKNRARGVAGARAHARAHATPDKKDSYVSGSNEPDTSETLSSSLRSEERERASQDDNVVELDFANAGGDKVKARAPRVDTTKAIDEFNRFAAQNPTWASVRLPVSEERRRKVGTLLKRVGASAWSQCLVKAADSTWLNGDKFEGKVSLDWIVKHFDKTLEGHYDDKSKRASAATPDDWLKRYSWSLKHDGEWHPDEWGPHWEDAGHLGPFKGDTIDKLATFVRNHEAA